MKYLITLWLFSALPFMMACQRGASSQSEANTNADTAKQQSVENNTTARLQSDMEKLEQGIDFKAQGNEPFWSLEIDFDKAMRFTSLSHPEKLSTPVPEPAQMMDAPGERYRAVTEAGELIVTILKDSCADTMSGEKFPYKVRVNAKLTTDTDYTDYEGCGRYLTDYRLHNIWAVEAMQGEALNGDDFAKGLPTLEFDPEEGQVSGHDGCNRIFGKVTVQGKQLTFGMLAGTRMACPNMEKSDQLGKLLNEQTFTYTFAPRQLLLKQNDAVVLRLKNVD